MTKQEAIEILRDTPIDIRSTREDDIHTLYATAQGMAIDALEAQERQELIVGSYLLEEPSCSEKQINMAIGAITHMLSIGYYSEDMEDALNLAIKVLAETELSCSEEPSRSEPKTSESGSVDSEQPEIKTDRTTSGDLISRQDAIDALQKEIDEGIPPFNDAGIRCGVRFASSIIENLPSAQQERKKGEWIDVSEDYGDYDYKCSICGSVQWDNTDFCPDCGADMMRGGEDE